jgi:hypothetical protein
MKPQPRHLDQACPAVFEVDDLSPHDPTPLCIHLFHTSEGLFQAFFLRAENGFVGEAELFLRNPRLSNESLNL